MSYAMLYDVPADEKMYRQITAAIGDEKPQGLVVHLVLQAESGLRHIEVWNSQQDWQRFHDERLEPAVHACGRVAELIDVRCSARTAGHTRVRCGPKS